MGATRHGDRVTLRLAKRGAGRTAAGKRSDKGSRVDTKTMDQAARAGSRELAAGNSELILKQPYSRPRYTIRGITPSRKSQASHTSVAAVR